MCSLREFISRAPEIKEGLELLVRNIGLMTDYASALVVKMRSVLDHLDLLEGDVIDLKRQLLECKNVLLKTHYTARTFMSRVEKSLKFGDLSTTEREEMKGSVKDGKYKEVNAYFKQLGLYFSQIEESYNHFVKYHGKAKEACKVGISTCKTKMAEAATPGVRNAGDAARNVGKAAIGIGVLTGVTATIAGIATFGVGAPIVLGISAPLFGVGAVAGGGAAAGGGLALVAGNKLTAISNHYKSIEMLFKDISDGFLLMETNASSIDAAMKDFKEKIRDINFDIVAAKPNIDRDIYRIFGKTFDTLVEAFKASHEEIERYRLKMQEDKEKVENLQVAI